MGKKQDKSAAEELNDLMGGSAPTQEATPEPKEELTSEEVTEKVKKIMAVVVVEGESDFFLMQELLEQCSALLRVDIQEEFYADPDQETGGNPNG